MDTKKILLISLIAVAILASVSAVSAGWFGPDTIECKQFSIEIPEGYHKSSEWTDNLFDDFLYIWSDDDDNKTDRNLEMWEVSSFDSFNRSDSEQIIDSYEEDGIKIDKCYDPESNFFENYTHAEFSKDGHNYVIKNEFKGNLNDINLKDDIKLIKTIRETITQK